MKLLNININYINNDKTAFFDILPNRLIKHNIISTIFAPTRFNFSGRSINGYNFSDMVVPVKCYNQIDRFFYHFKQRKILNALQENIRLEDKSCVNAYTLFSDGGIAYKLKKTYNIPYIVSVRNTDINYFFKYRFDLHSYGVKILKNASAIICLSNSTKEKVLKYLAKRDITNHDNIYLIPNGIDEFWFENCNYSNKTLTGNTIKIIYVGSINKNKNVITTYNALDYIQSKGFEVEFNVVGRIHNESIVKQITKDARVNLYPFMSMKKLLSMYRSNDIFVMPSFNETFGLVYAEAMSQGLPVIYTKNQGFDMQFPDGKVGYSVNPNDPEMLAGCVHKIINNYSEISQNAVRSVKKFNWKDIAEKYSMILKETANNE